MRYALDTDVIVRLQKAGQVAALKSVGRLPIVVTEYVWDELIDQAAALPQRVVDERRELLSAMVDSPTELLPETPESLDFNRLKESGLGPGERSIMAYALHHPDVKLVLLDRLALHRAIEEFQGQQVLSLHGALRALEPHGVTRQMADAISASFCRENKPHRPPLWW